MWGQNNGCEYNCPWRDHSITEYLVDPKVVRDNNKELSRKYKKEMKAFKRAKERGKDYNSSES